MLSDRDKQTLVAAVTILRIEARYYYDEYKRTQDSRSDKEYTKGYRAHEKYRELERMANELEVVAFGSL
jgi:hypothetical protein